jgi:predicted DNA-binding protein (MmcQ/YjbR family)
MNAQPTTLSAALKKAEAAVAKRALAYPETHEDHPWGHRAFKVKGKTFLFISGEPGTLGLTMKLPVSGTMALQFPFARATGYGLGKSGWVDCRFSGKDRVPVDLIETWLDESFRAVAPKRVVARLEASENEEAATLPKKSRSRKR